MNKSQLFIYCKPTYFAMSLNQRLSGVPHYHYTWYRPQFGPAARAATAPVPGRTASGGARTPPSL